MPDRRKPVASPGDDETAARPAEPSDSRPDAGPAPDGHAPESPHPFAAVLEGLGQGVGVFGADFRLVAANGLFGALLGLPGELTRPGTGFARIAEFCFRDGAGAAERNRAARVGDPFKFSIRVPGGAIVEVHDLPLPRGGVVTVCTDLSEREAVAGNLAESEQQVRAILANAVEGIITIGTDGVIRTFNPAAEKMFGYTAREMIGRNVALLTPESVGESDGGYTHDAYVRAYLETGRGGIIDVGARELAGRHKDGHLFPVEINVSEFLLGAERRFIGTLRDVTDRKQAEAALTESEASLKAQVVELRDREQRLEAQGAELVELAENMAAMHEEVETLNKQKDKFFSIIAHDLKSPFNALLGFASMIEAGGAEMDPAQVVDYGGQVHKAARQAYMLLEDLLDWARLQMGRMTFEPAPFAIGATLQTNLFFYEPVAEQKGVKIVARPAHGVSVHADNAMVDTVLRNLINNAIKFTPEGGAVTLAARRLDEWIEVSVADDGVGIAPERIGKLFKIEEKTSTRGTEGEAGTGLGLQLCKELVEKHGGRISVDSRPGRGTTFRFTLPRADGADDGA